MKTDLQNTMLEQTPPQKKIQFNVCCRSNTLIYVKYLHEKRV